ncbi:hypothetical protein [Comamonas terrae]|uniref:Uncharacterized protein n=1 Tax=Comamonas terrae TaxID=673548 RepID=A0ABW5UQF6_9BURK|nr:hypothetical protein [Comamonas terrae]
MQLFHTSPTKIEKITTDGRFGEFLFFSNSVYTMTASAAVVYSLDLADADVIEAGQLFYHNDAAKLDGLVTELAARLDINTDDAEALIEESKSVYDLDNIAAEDAADASWDVQLFTARAAKLLGYRAVQVQDEQGAAYLVDMLGHETELTPQA